MKNFVGIKSFWRKFLIARIAHARKTKEQQNLSWISKKLVRFYVCNFAVCTHIHAAAFCRKFVRFTNSTFFVSSKFYKRTNFFIFSTFSVILSLDFFSASPPFSPNAISIFQFQFPFRFSALQISFLDSGFSNSTFECV